MAPHLLEATGLRAGYGGTAVVHGIDLHVDEGEVVVLLGANGAGKTTTLLTLAGFLQPQAGSIRWRGRPIARAAHMRARAGIAFVGERAVFHQLTVEENLRLGASGAASVFKIFPELQPLRRRRAGLLSGGEQQMLAIGRAVAGAARLLVVDELSLGLAPVVVVRLLDAVRSSAASGMGVLLVEQQLGRALSVADRGYVMRRGVITFSGIHQELVENEEGIRETYLAEQSALDSETALTTPRRDSA